MKTPDILQESKTLWTDQHEKRADTFEPHAKVVRSWHVQELEKDRNSLKAENERLRQYVTESHSIIASCCKVFDCRPSDLLARIKELEARVEQWKGVAKEMEECLSFSGPVTSCQIPRVIEAYWKLYRLPTPPTEEKGKNE